MTGKFTWAVNVAVAGVVALAAVGVRADALEGITRLDLPNYNYTESGKAGRTLGWVFTPTVDIEVSALGFYDADKNGLFWDHHVGLWKADGEMLATATIESALDIYDPEPDLGQTRGDDESNYLYESIDAVRLQAGRTYIIGATVPIPPAPVFLPPVGYDIYPFDKVGPVFYLAEGDLFPDLPNSFSVADEILSLGSVYTDLDDAPNVLAFPSEIYDETFFGANFLYTVVPEPATLLLLAAGAAIGIRRRQRA